MAETMTKPGPKPRPDGQTGKKFHLYLSADAVAALYEMAPEGTKDWKSGLVSEAIVELAKARRRRKGLL